MIAPAWRRIARAIAGATIAAGAVGLARQRYEAMQVRRGRAARVLPATKLVPPVREGPVAARIARWTPSRPRTTLTRAAAAVWAAPVTAVGLVGAAAAGALPRWDSDLGCFVAVGSGISRPLMRAAGVSANAVGHIVVSTVEHPSPPLLIHESAHVRQAERLGPLLALLYPWWLARYGYRNHPLERGARAATRKALLQGPSV